MFADKNSKLITKNLSKILRHNKDGVINIDEFGYSSIDEVISYLNGTKVFNEEIIKSDLVDVLNDGIKTRFGLDDTGTKIRALSGHSFDVNLGYDSYIPTSSLFFGTTENARSKFEEYGFNETAKKMIRLVDTYEKALEIAEDRPDGEYPLVIEIDAEALYAAGHKFLKADSGEILSEKFDKDFILNMSTNNKEIKI